MTTRATLLIAGALISVAPPAEARVQPAGDARQVADRMWRTVAARLGELAARRPSPPQPVVVNWGPVSLGRLDLAQPVLDLAVGDVDGDGDAELVALTASEVIVLRVAEGRAVELARAALPNELAVPRPRSAVGSVRIVGQGIVARSSQRAAGARYALADGALREVERVAWFPVCGDEVVAELVPGRHELDAASVRGLDGLQLPAALWTARCGDGLVDTEGAGVAAVAVVAAGGAGFVARGAPCGAVPCAEQPITRRTLPEPVGDVVAVGDLDRDGRVDVLTTALVASEQGDVVDVLEWDVEGLVSVYRSPPLAGAVVAAAIGDLDRDGVADAVIAVRGAGAGVELWALAR